MRAIRKIAVVLFAVCLLSLAVMAQDKVAASTPEGKALAQKAVAAMGDAKLLASIKNYKSTLSMVVSTPQGEMTFDAESLLVLPNRMSMKLTAPFGEIRLVSTPTGGFRSLMGNTQELPADEAKAQSEIGEHSDVVVAQNLDNPAYAFVVRGDGKVGEVSVKLLDITYKGKTFTWGVDPSNGHVLSIEDTGFGMQGAFRQKTLCSEWKSFNGFTTATHWGSYDGETKVSEITVKNAEFNIAVDESAFKQ